MTCKSAQRVISAVLALVMVLAMVPMSVLSASAAETTYTLDATADLTAFSKGEKADGDSQIVNDYFTIIYSANSKVDSSNKSFSDGYSATQRINFGGKSVLDTKNVIKFTTTQATATVKVWWVAGGDARPLAIWDASGNEVAVDGAESVGSTLYISEFALTKAGTYSIANTVNNNYIFKVEVTETPVVEETTMTVYFENNWAWTEPSVYYWGSTTSENPAWPGYALANVVDKSADGYDIYKVELPKDITGLIFNGTGGYGFEQSTDITSGWSDGICYYMQYSSETDTKDALTKTYTPSVPETTAAPESETTVAPEDETTVAPEDETTVAPDEDNTPTYTEGLIDVWDFGAEQLDSTKYNNMLTVDEINSWFPGITPGTSSTPLLGFTSSDGQLMFEANGKTNNRLRTTNTALCRHDEKSLTDADGNVYTGYIYSNSSSTSAIYVGITATAGDIVTLVVGSNGGDSLINFEAPSGAVTTGDFVASGAKAQILTFYAGETGMYKIYSTTEKLVLARIYRESTKDVTVTGSVTAPAELTDYSLVFTNDQSGAVVEASVADGAYTATLKDNYTYTLSLKDANGYIITSDAALAIEKGSASATKDVDIIAVTQVTISGNITGLTEDALAAMTITLETEETYKPVITVTGSAYTFEAEVGASYNIVVSGINDYALTSDATVSYTEATTADITFEAKPTYAITIAPTGATLADLAAATFTFTNLNEEGYVYTFTGTDAIALRDGTYSVKVTNSGIFVQQLTSNVKVNGEAVTKTIPFSSNVTEWDFRTDDYTGQNPYNGLEITGGKKHGSSYGMQIKSGTIVVPVPGSCQIVVSVGYNWDITDGTDTYTDNTNSGDTDVTFTYSGEKGTVTLTAGSNFTSYIKKIQIVESVEYKETVTVGATGCDYTTINAALAAVAAMPRPNGERVTISIQPGNYEEMLVINTPNVTLKNASATPSTALTNKGVDIDANAVRITHYYGCGYNYYSMDSNCKYDETVLAVNKENGYTDFVNPGDGTTNDSYWNATVIVKADGFQAEGIIFENSFNQYVSPKAANDVIVPNSECKEGSVTRGDLPVGSTAVQDKAYVERAAALAIANNVKQASFDNCKFIGRQDTLYGGTGVTAAFYDCAIYGGTDYIFGGMTAVFAKCDLVANTSEDGNDKFYITAAQTAAGSHGYLMYNCHITSTVPGVDTASEYTSKPGYYGRPWAANSGEAVFYNTVIDAADTHWYDMSPSLIMPEAWLSTLSGQSALCGEYGTYEYAKDVDNSANRASWAAVFETETLASGEDISVATFLGTWDAFAGKDMTITMPTDDDKVDNAPEEEPGDDDTATGTVFTLDVTADMTAFAAGAKADSDTETFHNYFTVIYSAKTKVDSSSKTFDDGYAATQRLNFGGSSSFATKNLIQFKTTYPATVKIWWVSGGDGRTMGIYDSTGAVIANTDATASVKNTLYIDELELTAGGTYYLGVPEGSNYLFKMEVTEHPPVEYVLDVTADMTAFAAGAKADGDTEVVNDFFTVIYSAKTKVDSSSKTFDDGYAATQRLNFGGSSSFVTKNLIQFKTTGASTVKIWWVSGGDGRTMGIYDSTGAVIASTDATASVKNTLYIDELTLEEAGTYYLGVPEGSNYLFKLSVTVGGGAADEIERTAWDDVATPDITAAADDGNGNISVTVSAVVGTEGGDEVLVYMYDAEGNELASKRSIAESDTHTVTFAPDASGTYTIKAYLCRDGEENKDCEPATVSFVLPLGTPAIASVTNTGADDNGAKINVVWGSVDEATAYNVYVDGTLAGTTSELEYEVTGLTVGTKYSFTVSAVRGEEEGSQSKAATATATESAQRVWGFTRYGDSTNDANNGFEGNINEGSVTVYSEGGKGKVQSTVNGLAFYYTAIPTEYNFTLKATITVDSWKYSNGQEGFGLLATDRLGPNGDSTSFWTNEVMAMGSKIEYRYDYSTGKFYSTSETLGDKITMKQGVGTQVQAGLTMADVTGATPTGFPEYYMDPLDLTAIDQELTAGTYNIIGNAEAEVPGTIAELTTFTLEIQKNNTGYFVTYYDAEGNVLRQIKYYGPDMLSTMDTENVYAGFFASRNARITVTDMTLTTILATEDAPAEERPITYVEPTISITSGATSNSDTYTAYLYSNVAGTADVYVGTELVAEDVAMTAQTRCDVPVTIAEGSNALKVIFTPDPDQDLGDYTELSSTDPVEATITVSYSSKFANLTNLYIAPNGTADGDGSKTSPLDVYTAISYVQPGQTIVVMEGTYKISTAITIPHGIDGTADAPIRMVADPEAATRPVFDFQKTVTGITHGGDYWYFQGFDVTNSLNGQKGFLIAGHYNTLDQVNAYNNGNSGIQLSRMFSSDPKSEWPSNNLILNCTSHNNADAGYEDADGFAAKLTIGEGNVFDGCVAYNNADDGWDLFAKVDTGPIGSVVIRNCVAYANGYLEDGTNAGNGNGFKMGGTSISGKHQLINSYAFFNKAKGIDSNSCPDIIVVNSTSYNNESYNVALYTNNAANTDFSATGIVSFKDSTIKSGMDIGENLKPKGTQDTSKYLGDTNYYWDGSASKNASGAAITADMFVSLEFKGVARNVDGTIDLQGFLELNDKAPEGVGASPDGMASGDVELVESAIIRKGSTLSLEDVIYVIDIFDLKGIDLTTIDLTTDAGLLAWSVEEFEALTEVAYDADHANAGLKAYMDTGCYYGASDGIFTRYLYKDACYVGYVKLADGTYIYSDVKAYSPADYAYNMLGKEDTSETTKTLCVALLNYISAAQKYFYPETAESDLANKDLSAEQKAIVWDNPELNLAPAVPADKQVACDTSVFAGLGKNLLMEEKVSIVSLYKINTDTVANAKEAGTIFWTAEQFEALSGAPSVDNFGEGTKVTGLKVYRNNDGQWYSVAPKVAAKDMADTQYYILGYVIHADGTVSYSGVMSYTFEQYISNMVSKTTTSAVMLEFAQRLYIYERAAKAALG